MDLDSDVDKKESCLSPANAVEELLVVLHEVSPVLFSLAETQLS